MSVGGESNPSPRGSMLSLGLEPSSAMSKGYANFLAENLLTNSLYEEQVNCQQIRECINESEMIAQKIVNKIINDGATQLYDKYIGQKIEAHSITRILHLTEITLYQELLFYDDRDEGFYEKKGSNRDDSVSQNPHKETFQRGKLSEENEPTPPRDENWKGLAVGIDKLQNNIAGMSASKLTLNIHNNNELDSNSAVFSSHSRRSVTLDRIRKSEGNVQSPSNKFTRESAFKTDKSIKLVDLSVPRELVREEEQLRVLKEREFLIRQEKMSMEAIRTKEVKEQQSRLKGMQDLKKNQLTYDYDGKFILIAPVKLDKLPLLTTSVNHAVTRADSKDNNKPPAITNNTDKISLNSEKLATVISDKQRSTNSTNMNGNNNNVTNDEDTKIKKQKETEKLLQQQQAQLLQQQQQQQQQQVFQPSKVGAGVKGMDAKDIFEAFGMSQGVTYVEQNKEKKGQTFGSSLDISQLLSANSPVRISKTEYNKLILGGNLNRGNNKKNNNNTTQDQSDSKNHMLSLNDHSQIISASKELSFIGNNRNNTSLNSASTKKSRVISKSFIRVASESILFQSLHDASIDDDVQLQEEIKKAEEKKKQELARKRSILSKILNPVDEFNLKMQQGKIQVETRVNNLPPILPFKTSHSTNNASAKNQFYSSNSRQRAPRHVVYANIHPTRLPPPALGNTIGHGFLNGFNPENLQISFNVHNTSVNSSTIPY